MNYRVSFLLPDVQDVCVLVKSVVDAWNAMRVPGVEVSLLLPVLAQNLALVVESDNLQAALWVSGRLGEAAERVARELSRGGSHECENS